MPNVRKYVLHEHVYVYSRWVNKQGMLIQGHYLLQGITSEGFSFTLTDFLCKLEEGVFVDSWIAAL